MSDKNSTNKSFLYELEALLQQRQKKRPEGSYTTHLFNEGIDKIAQKVGEEAVEVVIASKNRERGEVVYESADLIYHLLVLLVEQGIPFEEVVSELQRRSRS